LQPLVAQLLPPPAAIDPAKRLGTDLAPADGARIAKRVCVRDCAPSRA